MLTVDEMENLMNEIIETFPPDLFRELNGGIVLLPEMKLNPHGNAEDLVILGEYQYSNLFGRMIAIYFGSMIKIHGHLSKEEMSGKLIAVLKHEFRHHLESLAGERDLEIEDEQYIATYLKERRQAGLDW